MAAQEGKEPYGLDPAFERAVLVLCCQRPSFWSRIGHALDPERMQNPLAPLVLACVAMIARESGRGPRNALLVMQRIRRLVEMGKVKAAAGAAFNDLVDDAVDAGLPDEDYAVRELVPVVRRKIQSEAVLAAHDEWAKRGDFTSIVDMLEKANRLGEEEKVGRVSIDSDGFSSIDQLKATGRLPTGILELDMQLGGGLPSGTMGVVVANSGGGKSMFLVSCASEAVRHGMHVGFVTLELPEAIQFSRIVANLTGVPVNDIIELDQHRERARSRLKEMASHIGPCHVGEFPPHATTVKNLIEWIDECEQVVGRKMDAIAIDYGDKLHEPSVPPGNEYLAYRYIYEGMRRDIAVAKDMRLWTAAAGTRTNRESRRRLDMQHVAESMHKVKVTDLLVTINDKDGMLEFFVAKWRLGNSRFVVGPLPSDFEKARIVPHTREFKEGW